MTAKRIADFGASAFLVLVLGCNPCKEEIWSSVASPNGRWLAVTVKRDCGATTGEILSVNVRPVDNQKLSQENNALVIKHGYAISTSWRDATTLKIECRECTVKEIAAKQDHVGPIHIQYALSGQEQ